MSKILVTKAEPWNNLTEGKDTFIAGCAAIQCLRTADYEVHNRTGGLEEDVKYRQYCSYCLVQDAESGDYLVAVRKPSQTEIRLHGKKYIGIGGHIEDSDITEVNDSINHTFVDAALRELREEIGVRQEDIINGYTVGIIVAHSRGVIDQVHIGLVCHVIVDRNQIELETEEAHLHDAKWQSLSNLILDYSQNKDSYEGWTQILMNRYITTNNPLSI